MNPNELQRRRLNRWAEQEEQEAMKRQDEKDAKRKAEQLKVQQDAARRVGLRRHIQPYLFRRCATAIDLMNMDEKQLQALKRLIDSYEQEIMRIKRQAKTQPWRL